MIADRTYKFMGQEHVISGDEIFAIERSGAPHRVQDYADAKRGHELGRGYFDMTQESVSLAMSSMCERPGKTESKVLPLRTHITERDHRFLSTFIAYATTEDLSEATGIDPSIIIWIRRTVKVHAQVLKMDAQQVRIIYETFAPR